jgi:hypothetical protein
MTNLTSFLLGSGITVIFAIVPFVLSSRQLNREAAMLRRLNEILLNTLEEHGIIKLNRDANGNIIGRSIVLPASTGTLQFTGSLAALHKTSDSDKKATS